MYCTKGTIRIGKRQANGRGSEYTEMGKCKSNNGNDSKIVCALHRRTPLGRLGTHTCSHSVTTSRHRRRGGRRLAIISLFQGGPCRPPIAPYGSYSLFLHGRHRRAYVNFTRAAFSCTDSGGAWCNLTALVSCERVGPAVRLHHSHSTVCARCAVLRAFRRAPRERALGASQNASDVAGQLQSITPTRIIDTSLPAGRRRNAVRMTAQQRRRLSHGYPSYRRQCHKRNKSLPGLPCCLQRSCTSC